MNGVDYNYPGYGFPEFANGYLYQIKHPQLGWYTHSVNQRVGELRVDCNTSTFDIYLFKYQTFPLLLQVRTYDVQSTINVHFDEKALSLAVPSSSVYFFTVNLQAQAFSPVFMATALSSYQNSDSFGQDIATISGSCLNGPCTTFEVDGSNIEFSGEIPYLYEDKQKNRKGGNYVFIDVESPEGIDIENTSISYNGGNFIQLPFFSSLVDNKRVFTIPVNVSESRNNKLFINWFKDYGCFQQEIIQTLSQTACLQTPAAVYNSNPDVWITPLTQAPANFNI